MSVSKTNFDDISEGDVLDHIQAGIPEGVLVDYKRDAYARNDAGIKEFLKDISSFANTAGGHLVIGVDEDGGIPTAITALSGNSDMELQWLENVARDGLEPRIAGLRMKSITVSGGFVIVIRIPKSWNPPHRVSARNTNRIYGRNSAGAYEYSVDELRAVFTTAATALDRIRAFRAERLAKIDAGEAIAQLIVNNGRLVLHLVPASAFGTSQQVDVSEAYAKQDLLRPMNSMGRSPKINFDGFCNESTADNGRCYSYTHIFRTGAIEAVKVRVVTDNKFVPILALDEWIFECLPGYLSALQELDVPPPIVLMISLQGIRGTRLAMSESPTWDAPPIIDRNTLELPEIIIDRYGSPVDYQRAARPAFDALWNTGGVARSRHFDDTGRWIGKVGSR